MSLTFTEQVSRMGNASGIATTGAGATWGQCSLTAFSLSERECDLPKTIPTTKVEHQSSASRRLNGTSLNQSKPLLCRPCNRVPVGLDDASLSDNPYKEINARAVEDLTASSQSVKARRDISIEEPQNTGGMGAVCA